MKIRKDFVTNSSSSSFIVLVDNSHIRNITPTEFKDLLDRNISAYDEVKIHDLIGMKDAIRDKAEELNKVKNLPLEFYTHKNYKIAELEMEIGNLNLMIEQAETAGLEIMEFEIGNYSPLTGMFNQLVEDRVLQIIDKREG